MRHLIICIVLALSTLAGAHPGEGDHHHHQPVAISKAEAGERAKKVVAAKVNQGKLSEAWLKKQAEKTYKKTYGHGPEWVVEFHDPKAADEKQRVLYVFMTTSGKTLGINFTGQ